MRRLSRLIPFVSLAVLWPALAAAPVAPQIFDINKVAGTPISSAPHSGVTLNGTVLFTAYDVAHGNELWASDGTANGSRLVVDIYPGPGSSNPKPLGQLGTSELYAADDGIGTHGLWLTNGTTAGSLKLAAIQVNGTAVAAGSHAFFLATTEAEGTELWVTDGTSAGTQLVSDLNPGVASGAAAPLVASGSSVYFVGSEAAHGSELWKSDGTATGTTLVVDTNPGAANGLPTTGAVIAAAPTFVFFAADDGTHGSEPFATTGTGATSLGDLNPTAATSSSPSAPIVLGSSLLFEADPGTGATLFATDGSLSGTKSLGVAIGAGDPPTAFGTRALFTGTDAAHGNEPWITDGTVAGTVLLADVLVGTTGSFPRGFVSAVGHAFFYANDAMGSSLFVTDGTGANTLAIGEGIAPGNFHVSGTGLFFAATDPTHGGELWHSDGTATGTIFLADANPGIALGFDQILGEATGGKLVFAATDGTLDLEPWVSDGTPANTLLLQNIEPATHDGSSNPDLPVLAGDYAFFTANDGVNGVQVWRTDGTQAGTLSPTIGLFTNVVTPSNPFPNCPTPAPPTLRAMSTAVAFIATDATNGMQLWVTDGTVAGTRSPTVGKGLTLGRDIIAVVDDIIYFAATDAAHGNELWSSDGTAMGTSLVADIVVGTTGSNPRLGAALGDQLVFIADALLPGGPVQPCVYISDGSGPGTVGVDQMAQTTIAPLPQPGPPLVSGGSAFYPFRTSSTVLGVSATDGAAVKIGLKTLEVADHELVAFAGGVLMACELTTAITKGGGGGVSGYEPCFFDGTNNAVLLADVQPGTASSHPQKFTAVGALAYFTTATHVMYVTDGTKGPGTHRFTQTNLSVNALVGSVNGQLLFVDGTNHLSLVTGPGRFEHLATVTVALPNNLPQNLPAFFDHVFFTGNSQLWQTNGTPEGTVQLTTTTTSPANPVIFGTQLLVAATDVNRGRELFGVPLDGTPPDITPVLSGTQSDAGYFTSDVNLSWQVVENDSALQSKSGCEPIVVTADTPGAVFTCTATSVGGTAVKSVTVKRDATKPVVLCVPEVIAEATSAAGAVVNYPTPVAQDAIDPSPGVSEDHAPGSTFPLGDTAVTATATDAAGNAQTCHLTVTVRDMTPPALTCPTSMAVPATGADGAAVTFAPTATDLVDASPTVTATPASGSTFPPGDSLVDVTATDSHGNTSRCEFLVTVSDMNAPAVTCPADQSATATALSGIAITYPDPTVTDAIDPMPAITENHVSGDTFPIGTTTVIVTATNRTGLSSSCRFKVTVTGNVTNTTPSHCGCDGGAGAALALLGVLTLRRRRRYD